MKTLSRWIRLTAGCGALAGLAACSDAPNAPIAAAQPAAIAVAFEALAQDEAAAGAFDRSEDWRWVANALREGVQPSRVEIMTFGKMEEYNAFVRAIEVPTVNSGPRREAGHMMLAWQRHGSELINHAVRLWSPGDKGTIIPREGVHGAMPAGAHVDYLERGASQSPWMGFQGIAQIEERWAGGRCHNLMPPELQGKVPEGVICQKAHFAVRFEASLRPVHEEVVPLSHSIVMWMAEQKVVGLKFIPGN